jgi:hypothetical protein
LQAQREYAKAVSGKLNEALDLGQSVQSVATASSLGDYFQYVIDRPVDLARQKSALLPIVNKDVEGKRVSIYNPAVQPKHPLLGLKFKNTTGMPLTQGPITVFEGSVYAGDTRVLDLQPDDVLRGDHIELHDDRSERVAVSHDEHRLAPKEVTADGAIEERNHPLCRGLERLAAGRSDIVGAAPAADLVCTESLGNLSLVEALKLAIVPLVQRGITNHRRGLTELCQDDPQGLVRTA